MEIAHLHAARCRFVLRRPAGPHPDNGEPGFTYVSIHTTRNESQLVGVPPSVGDYVFLSEDGPADPTRIVGMFRVYAVSWVYPSPGSTHWPFDKALPIEGLLLTVYVEDPGEGPVANEIPSQDPDDAYNEAD